MFKNSEHKTSKGWPKDYIWPEPLHDGYGIPWEADLVDEDALDQMGQELMEIREYYDSLVEEGTLNEDYSLSEDLDEFEPEIGEDYWDEGFLVDLWEEDLTEHMNLLKVDPAGPAFANERIIGYDFVNENLLRQAFTRRTFAIEYGLSGCNEELEFLGDSVLGTVVTREITKHLAEVDPEVTDAPFVTKYNEGDFSKIRSGLVSKENLASRAVALGLDKYIL